MEVMSGGELTVNEAISMLVRSAVTREAVAATAAERGCARMRNLKERLSHSASEVRIAEGNGVCRSEF